MFSKIDGKFWTDQLIRKVPEDARILMLYLLTSPQRNIIGFYQLPEPLALYHLNWDAKRYRKAKQALVELGRIMIDDNEDLILIINFIKWNKLVNPKHAKSAISVFNDLPDSPLMKKFCESLKKIEKYEEFSKAVAQKVETLSIPIIEENFQEQLLIDKFQTSETEAILETKNNDDKKITEFVDLYHQILGGSLPKVEKITDERKKKIKKILEEYSFEKITLAFENIKKSDFLCGRGANDWKNCSFDWIIQTQKFLRIIEGVYNQTKNNIPRGFQDIQEFLNSNEGGVINE